MPPPCTGASAAAALLLVAGVLAGLSGQDALSTNCTVETDTGPVQGYIREADYGAAYLSFRGVPYASQPVGGLRFKPLQRATPWTRPLDARDEGPACPQHTLFYAGLMTPRGTSEACIHLNVHVPLHPPSSSPGSGEPERPRPVLVFVHGGGFGFGSGDADLHGPEYLVGRGVLLVTFNYRLGALGFLSLDTPQLPGNLGLRDAVEALRWVRRNIAAFGGDPDNVTIAGQSAGAVAAHLLTLSPLAAGLFHRVILMSGVATRSWFSTSPINAKRVAAIFLEKLNITASDPEQTFRALQRTDVASIVAAMRAMQDEEGLAVFVPVVESAFPGVEPFLDGDPATLVRAGRQRDVPVLIGHTDAECGAFATSFRDFNLTAKLETNRLLLVPPSLLFATPPERLARLAADVERRYFEATDDEGRRFDDFLDYCTEAYYAYPARRLARWLTATARRSPVYLYRFSHAGDYSPVKRVASAGYVYRGAGHVEDQTYLLRVNSYAGSIAGGSVDETVEEWMTSLFTNYIQTGEPTPACADAADGDTLVWPTFEKDSELYLEINDSLTVAAQARPWLEMLDFFDALYEERSPSGAAPAAHRRRTRRATGGGGGGGSVERRRRRHDPTTSVERVAPKHECRTVFRDPLGKITAHPSIDLVAPKTD